MPTWSTRFRNESFGGKDGSHWQRIIVLCPMSRRRQICPGDVDETLHSSPRRRSS